MVRGDSLMFRGTEVDDADAYLWEFDHAPAFSGLNPGLVELAEIGISGVGVIPMFDAEPEPFPHEHFFQVVEDSGDLPNLKVIELHVPDPWDMNETFDVFYKVVNAGDGVVEPFQWRVAAPCL